MIVKIASDKKLNNPTESILVRGQHKQTTEAFNEAESSKLQSANRKLCWLGVISSPFCSFAVSLLRQRSPSATVLDPKLENTLIMRVKELGFVTR